MNAETGYPDRLFVGFLIPPSGCWDSSSKLGHYRFLLNPIQFITIHLPTSSTSPTLYSLGTEKSEVK
jgi:hypothetical protein